MSEHTPEPAPTPTPERRSGRRAAPQGAGSRRRVDVLVALAIVLPAVVAVAVGVIGDERLPEPGLLPPATSALTSATVVCPAAAGPDARPVRAARIPGVPGGEVTVRTAAPDAAAVAETEPVTVEAGGSTVVPGSTGATVLEADGRAAPGLTAGRGERLALPECRPPSYDEWLVGLSATARYASSLELVNPDDGEAVVDVALYDGSGPVEEPALRGIQVPARGVKRVDLATVAPRRAMTAAHLTVTRGRVTATVRNTRDPLGSGRVTTDFLPAQAEPSTESLFLGLPDAAGGATLYVLNPGEDEVRASLRLVTQEATFTPTGAEDVVVPPRSLQAVDLRELLSGESAKGVVGLALESTGPVASSVRLLARNDLALLAPVVELREETTAVLPEGASSLLLGGATRTGVIHVTSYDAEGGVVGEEQVEIGPDRAASLALPPEAVRIAVEPRNTRISGVVTVASGGPAPGFAALRVLPTQTKARIPVVLPQSGSSE